jgi:ABC-type multidrug transport system fused ATPase/permease subunit
MAAMFLLNWKLTALSLLPLPVMMYVIYRVRARLTGAGEAQQKAISTTNEMLEKTFSGIRIVKAFGAEPGQARALGRILDQRIGVQYRLQRLWATITTFDTVASRIGQLVVLAVGGALAVRGEVTVGTLYAFFVYLDMLVQPMWDLPNLVVTSRQAFVSIAREEELIRFPVEVEHGAEGMPVPALESLAFEGVRFAYEEGRTALEGLSFQARRGMVLAVVGPVASGKSTLLKLTAGLLLPSEGRILVNGHPLAHWRWNEFRRRIGYAPQDSLLFSESIRENVGMGRTAPAGAGEGDWVLRVLAVARMEDELAVLPLGTETVLGQKGSKVSGGQRQRISIARALYGRPELLLLDDCTASLDAENEDRLWTGLRAVLPDATVLLVSHRLATIRRADQILVLDAGRLADQGTHDELATRCDVYRRFLEREQERAKMTAAVGD